MSDKLSEEQVRLLGLGHCPWDVEPEEGEQLPEPHCHANRDGECDFAYCPQPLLRQPAVAERDRRVRNGRCNFYFGGIDGGNRCQKPLGHSDEEGHEWRAEREDAGKVSGGRQAAVEKR